MHDISLYLLDIIENSTAAGSTIISIKIEIDSDADLFRFVVDDNGRGLGTGPAEVMSPFYTTKPHKRVGLGLSLLQAAAEQADGSMTIGPSATLEGVRVEVRMRLSHIDRPPVGDPASTISTMMSAHPDVEFRACFQGEGRTLNFNTRRDIDSADPVTASMEAYRILRSRMPCCEYL